MPSRMHVLIVVGVLAAGCGESGGGKQDAGGDGSDVADGATTTCSQDADCGDGGRCVDGICRSQDYCASSGECGAGLFCNQITHRCVTAECTDSSDCGDGYICEEYACESICADVTCDPGLRCNPGSGECEPIPCTVSIVKCTGDADCGKDLHCDPMAFGCTECPSGFFCNIHQCFALANECKVHADCATSTRCNPETHVCEPFPETCASDRECTPKYCNTYTQVCQDDPFTGVCEKDEECQVAFGEAYVCHQRLHNCVLPPQAGQCYDTPDCGNANLVCDLKNNTCAPRGTVCGVDTDCYPDHKCVNGTCVFLCVTVCETDDVCASSQICRNGCCLEDKSCWDDWDCNAPEVCVDGWCGLSLPCLSDDAFEPNDTGAAATPLALPNQGQAQDHPGLYICPVNDDWYQVDVAAGGSLKVEIFFDNSIEDLDLFLYGDPDGNDEIDRGYTTADIEVVTVDAIVAATYWVQVKGYGDANPYSLRITHGTPGINPCSPDDAFEDNDGAVTATALPMPAEGAPAVVPDLLVCSGDEDWFAIPVAAGGGLKARIDFVDSSGDLILALFDPTGQDELDYSDSVDDYEEVALTRAPAAGTYFLRASGYQGAATGYSLTIENLGVIQVDCSDAGSEPNDSAGTATPAAFGNTSGLFLCQGTPQDQDWYQVSVNPGERLHASVAFNTDDGDLDLYLYQSDGTTVVDASDDSWSDTETVVGPRVLQATTYLIQVKAPNAGLNYDTPYLLSVVADPPIDCTDGGQEPNETAQGATLLAPGLHGGWVICNTNPRDRDWYRIPMAEGERLRVTINFVSTDGDLNLYLYEEDGTTLLDSSEMWYADSEDVDSGRLSSGRTLLVKVEADSLNDAAPYSMDVIVDPPIACSDDAFEPNDNAAQATALASPGSGSMTLCPGDVDAFALNAVRGDKLTFTLVNDGAVGDLDLVLYDPFGEELIRESSYGTVDEQLIFEVNSDGLYVIQVVHYDPTDEVAINYHLDLVLGTFTPCDNDAFEPNESPTQATLLTDMPFTQVGSDWVLEQTGLSICNVESGDLQNDWYALDLEQGVQLQVLARFIDADGDIDIWIYDSSLDMIDSGVGTSDNEQVDFLPDGVPATGRYFLKVKLYFTGQTTYDLVITTDQQPRGSP